MIAINYVTQTLVCISGVVLPVWNPQNPSVGDKVARAIVYFVALIYMFLGMSIIADRFMSSIEVCKIAFWKSPYDIIWLHSRFIHFYVLLPFSFRFWVPPFLYLLPPLFFQVITSQEKEITIKRPNGETTTATVRIWNETVSNLTLMALGSSAPEILLSVIEVSTISAGWLHIRLSDRQCNGSTVIWF